MQRERGRKNWNFWHRLPGKISACLHHHQLFTITAARAQAIPPLAKYHRTIERLWALPPIAPAPRPGIPRPNLHQRMGGICDGGGCYGDRDGNRSHQFLGDHQKGQAGHRRRGHGSGEEETPGGEGGTRQGYEQMSGRTGGTRKPPR